MLYGMRAARAATRAACGDSSVSAGMGRFSNGMCAAVLVGVACLIASCTSVERTPPQEALVLRDGSSRSMEPVFGTVPKTARFAFLATGQTSLYYVAQDGSVYWAYYQRQQLGFGIVPITARFAFLGTGGSSLFYVDGDGHV